VSKAYSVDDQFEAKIIETTLHEKKIYSVTKSNQIENFLLSFIENINQQSNLSQQEKYNIKAIISVFKNSLLYWQNV
jgi:hypothetical protein